VSTGPDFCDRSWARARESRREMTNHEQLRRENRIKELVGLKYDGEDLDEKNVYDVYVVEREGLSRVLEEGTFDKYFRLLGVSSHRLIIYSSDGITSYPWAGVVAVHRDDNSIEMKKADGGSLLFEFNDGSITGSVHDDIMKRVLRLGVA
jgi:hypothetical protein